MQNDDTRTAMAFAGLSGYETWMHYCAAGGPTGYFEFDAYLHGLHTLDGEDADLVSQAVNELIDDVCAAEEAGFCRAPYSWRPPEEACPAVVHATDGFDGFEDGFDAGFEDVLPFGPRVEGLAAPHTAATFGSRRLVGFDVGGLSGGPGIPLPPGAPLELLGDVLDSGVVGRALSGNRK
ncbi:hypothetical protein [Arthrobacter sp. MDT1-65]